MPNFLNHAFRTVKSGVRVLAWALSKPGFRMARHSDYCLITHPDARLNVVGIRGTLTYDSDGLATMHNSSFQNDSKFEKAYRAGKATNSWGKADPAWRAYICCWAAEQVKYLPGDFVECGVNRGGLSRTVADYVSFSTLGKTFYLLDTFSGLDEVYMTKTERVIKDPTLRGRYQDCYSDVCRTFADIPCKVIKGSVPETLRDCIHSLLNRLSRSLACAIVTKASSEVVVIS